MTRMIGHITLSPVQERILQEVSEEGSKVYSGRYLRSIRFLEKLGVVEVDWHRVTTIKGANYHHVWRITVKLAPGVELP